VAAKTKQIVHALLSAKNITENPFSEQ